MLFSLLKGARGGYLVQLAQAANGPFTDYAVSTSSRVLLHALTPMSCYWVRVRANGAAGPTNWSAPLRLVVI